MDYRYDARPSAYVPLLRWRIDELVQLIDVYIIFIF